LNDSSVYRPFSTLILPPPSLLPSGEGFVLLPPFLLKPTSLPRCSGEQEVLWLGAAFVSFRFPSGNLIFYDSRRLLFFFRFRRLSPSDCRRRTRCVTLERSLCRSSASFLRAFSCPLFIDHTLRVMHSLFLQGKRSSQARPLVTVRVEKSCFISRTLSPHLVFSPFFFFGDPPVPANKAMMLFEDHRSLLAFLRPLHHHF